MVGHDHIREDTNTVLRPDFAECVAQNLFYFIGAKDWQAVMSHRGEIVCGSCSRYLEHRNNAPFPNRRAEKLSFSVRS